MRRQTMLVAGGLILGLFGAALVLSYVKSVERRSPSGSQVIPVYVATRTIPAGTPGSSVDSMVKLDRVPQRYAAPRAITDLGPYAGQFTTHEIQAGATLTAFDFASFGASRGKLPIPKGHEAVAVAVPLDTGLAYYAAPGDRVNVYATNRSTGGETRQILRNIKVLATQPNPTKTSQAGASTNLVFVLAVTRGEAQALINAKQTASIWLSLVPETSKAAVR